MTPDEPNLAPNVHLDAIWEGLVKSWRGAREKEGPASLILKDVSNGMQSFERGRHSVRQLEGFTPPLREYQQRRVFPPCLSSKELFYFTAAKRLEFEFRSGDLIVAFKK